MGGRFFIAGKGQGEEAVRASGEDARSQIEEHADREDVVHPLVEALLATGDGASQDELVHIAHIDPQLLAERIDKARETAVLF